MNSAERKNLTHPIVPGVQRIMRIQSHPLRSQVLIETHRAKQPIPFNNLRSRVKAVLGAEETSDSTVAHILTELEGELLLSRSRRALFELTPLGSAAVEAQREYQQTLLPVVVSDQVSQQRDRLDEDLITQISQMLLENSRRPRSTPVPWILDIMRLQSDSARLNILLSLVEGVMDFQDLRHTAASRVGGEDIPGSTFSNLITALERKELLKREGKPKRPEYRLTELGLASIDAYDGYQERLIHPLVESVRGKIERDLGITVPNPLRMAEIVRSLYPMSFETMLEYVMRTTR